MVGKQIGNFRVIEKIGEGGMGVVYKAVDVGLDRPVALKMLNADLARNPELVERFRAEAKAQANLNHTNLATLYTFFVEEGNAFIVMEFVEGENFDQIIRRSGPMNTRDAVPWFKQALLGIGAAHRVGIIHRDVKPSNLMLNRQGIVKVMDFGIAKAIGTRGMTRTGMHLGTLAYMPPEQIQNRTVDVRSDIYALGITLYEMLSGHVPFESDSDFRIMQDHVTTPPPPLSRYYPYAPREFENVVAKALAKNPDDRFQTVEEFGAALEHPEKVSAPIPPLAVQPSAAAGRTIIESKTTAGAGPWQATAYLAPPPAAGGSVAAPPPAAVGSVAVPTVSLPVKPTAPSHIAAKIIVAAVMVAAVIVLAFVLRSGKTPVPPPLASGGAAGPSTGVSAQPPANPSSAEIVVAAGGSDTDTSSTPPASVEPQGGQRRPQTAQNHPNPQQPPVLQSPHASPQSSPAIQPPPQAIVQSFIVKHRHVVGYGAQAQTYFCAGALLVKPDGTASYACAATNDPSKRCEHVVFPPGSIRRLNLGEGGELHVGTASLGNWDFYDYNVPGSTSGAYQAILPFVR
jgi:eukaryotic-like serine/threonine-protein kinase